MSAVKAVFVVLVVSLACVHGSTFLRDKVAYVEDNRLDICKSSNGMLNTIAQQAIVALMDGSLFQMADSDGTYNRAVLSTTPLGDQQRLCSDERFLTQPTSSLCSGTLIAPDRVLTAGHCMDEIACLSRRFVFNYLYTNDSCSMPPITKDDVYRCVDFVRVETDTVDYAVVFLDRAVTGRTPVRVQSEAKAVDLYQTVNLIGFGSGIPAKIDSGGFVLNPRADILDFFVATTDSFAGNSGSGAFNDCGELIGVLVRGQTDYVTDGKCNRVNVVACRDATCSRVEAEELTYAWRAIAAAPDCRQHIDCSDGNLTCYRRCAPEDNSCTGWCLSSDFAGLPSPYPLPTSADPSVLTNTSFPSFSTLSFPNCSTPKSPESTDNKIPSSKKYFDAAVVWGPILALVILAGAIFAIWIRNRRSQKPLRLPKSRITVVTSRSSWKRFREHQTDQGHATHDQEAQGQGHVRSDQQIPNPPDSPNAFVL
jgi:hypothetical protein